MLLPTLLAFWAVFEAASGGDNDQCSSKQQEECTSKDFFTISQNATRINPDDVLVYTVASTETDGFLRYLHSAEEFGIKPIVLGLGEEWQGGDMQNKEGGGAKINLLKEHLQKYREDKGKIVLFTDGYDVIFLNDLKLIIDAFKKTEARVLFGAEAFCWPDKNLAEKYPAVTLGKRFLNSGLYIGYVPEILELLEHSEIKNNQDDQLFFSKAYLNENLRKKLNFKLDHNSEIFQNLNGATNEVEMFKEINKEVTEIKLRNILTGKRPLVLHGNGPSKNTLNALSNYLSRAWNEQEGCKHCHNGHIDLEHKKVEEMPVVYMALFIEQATPFLEEYLQKIYELIYPKEKIHLFVHNNVKYHSDYVNKFVEEHGIEYVSVKQIKPEDEISEWKARDLSLDQCLLRECDFYFSVDSIAHMDNPYTLRLLAEQNRTVVAPMLVRPGKAWSNFWGALTTEGFYARSSDYMEIVHNEKRGLWNVPFVSNCYLVNATLFKKYDRSKIHFARNNLDADMAFCVNLRDLDVFLYVSNRVDFGHLINHESFDTTMADPDMYQIFENERDWEDRYIHMDYPTNFNADKKTEQPCPDVYWFPIVTKRFCDDLIHMMETFGEWSAGKNEDKRLEGGYEAVPTRDIHMSQVAWERHWLYFLHRYVRPLQEHVFTGYFHDPPRSLMNFVVRYRPDEQPSLRPHHDSSTYTINIALNQRGVDYEGGGCRFKRYNCSVVDTRRGWMMMHPGRLTHYHEGLRVISGTRYIMIAFVDP